MPASQKRKILGVLFDWDGTLLNSYAADSAAYLAMFQQMEITWGLEDLARHYSPNWYNVYRAAGLHESRWAAADLAWRAKYATQKPQLLAGARSLLANLRKLYPLGLVTGGDRDRVLRDSYVSSVCCAPFLPACVPAILPKKNRILRRCVWPCAPCSCPREIACMSATRAKTCSWRAARECVPSACWALSPRRES